MLTVIFNAKSEADSEKIITSESASYPYPVKRKAKINNTSE